MPETLQSPAAARSPAAPQSLATEAKIVVAALLRRWLWIALATLAGLAAGLLFLLLTTPRYSATAQILIDPRAKRIVEGAVVTGGYGSSSAGADTLLVDSQMELIQSTGVLKRIVQSEQLHLDPEFAVPASSGGLRIVLRNTIGRALFGNEREQPPTTNPVDVAVWRFADRHLRVRRPGNTYVINISVMSHDPAKAARLANLVAQAYINDQVRATGDVTREATTALQGRVDVLRRSVETAESAVEAFRTQAGLLGSPNLLVMEQQLQQTNDKLILARSQAALAKARYEQVKDVSAKGGSVVLGAQSDALRSPVIANLRAALSRVERREAIVQQTLRPGHPEYAGAQTEKRAVLAQIDEELSRIRANAKAEFELAQSAETSLTAELKSQEARTAIGNQSQVRLRELQREAQSARAIFEQFLNRSKETGEQENFGRENTRIISEATVPPYPTFPPTLLVLCGALLAGLTAGTGAAWLAHVASPAPATPAPALRLPARMAVPAVAPLAAAAEPQPAAASTMAPVEDSPVARRRLRKMLAPIRAAKISEPTVMKTAGSAAGLASAPAASATHMMASDTGRPALETLARLPALKHIPAEGGAGMALAQTAFVDHIAAVDDVSAQAYPGYREVIDTILDHVHLPVRTGKAAIVMLVGADARADSASTALALAYRAAVRGQRTLLIDSAAADPKLSQALATNFKQQRPCVLDSATHLAELALNDTRTGLSLLPLALADLAHFTPDQQRRLVSGLRKLSQGFELVILDAGLASENQGVAYLTAIVDRVLIVSGTATVANGLTRLKAMDIARRFPTRAASAAIIETAAG